MKVAQKTVSEKVRELRREIRSVQWEEPTCEPWLLSFVREIELLVPIKKGRSEGRHRMVIQRLVRSASDRVHDPRLESDLTTQRDQEEINRLVREILRTFHLLEMVQREMPRLQSGPEPLRVPEYWDEYWKWANNDFFRTAS